MTIKEATKKMLWNIKNRKTREQNYTPVKDKDLALALGLTRASYSRLATGVTTPQIMTWAKICKMHSMICGENWTKQIIEELEWT